MQLGKLLATIALLLCAHTAHADVYRCGNTYSNTPCKDAKEVDVSPALSDPSGPTTTVIYLCRATRGARYWTPEPCNQNGWTIERTERVPANIPWEEQLAAARSQRSESIAAGRTPGAYGPSTNRNEKSQRCTQLRNRIQYLDDIGRKGGSVHTMEWQREERRNARNEEHRLGC